MTLQRKKALGRSTVPMKRTSRVKPVSDKRRKQAPIRKSIIEEVMANTAFCCARSLGGCWGPADAHELVKRSQEKDAHLKKKLIVRVCRFHNGWVEDHPREAQCYGLSIKAWAYRMDPERAVAEAARLRGLTALGVLGVPYWMDVSDVPDGWPKPPEPDES